MLADNTNTSDGWDLDTVNTRSDSWLHQYPTRPDIFQCGIKEPRQRSCTLDVVAE